MHSFNLSYVDEEIDNDEKNQIKAVSKCFKKKKDVATK